MTYFFMSKIYFFIKIIIVFIAVVLIYQCYKYYLVSSTFYSVKRNTSRIEVEKKLGKPNLYVSCGKYLWWGVDDSNVQKNNGECVVSGKYNFFLKSFSFGYSKEGLLVSKYQYFSE